MPVANVTYGQDITEAWGDSVADAVNLLESEMDTAQADIDAVEVRATNLENLGQKAYAQVTASQGGITTLTDLTGLTVTLTTVAGRRYKITAECYAFSTVANDVISLVIADGSNNQFQSGQVQPAGSIVPIKMNATYVHTPGAGSRTYKLRMLRVSGSGTVSMGGYSAAPAFILVEDIGPA